MSVQHGARLVFVDSLPRFEELVDTEILTPQTNNLPSDVPDDVLIDRDLEESLTKPLIVNLKNKLEYSGDPFLTETLQECIKNALQSQKKVLLFLNRKGVAKRLQCSDCGHLPQCGSCGNLPTVRLDDLVCDRCGMEMWIPKNCPSCGKPKIALKGIGGAKVASLLQENFPEHTVQRVEKGSVGNLDADILVVTEYFFSSCISLFEGKRFGLIADLGADIHLNGSGFRGAEMTARKLYRLIQYAERQKAECIIQTWLPDIVEPMLNLQAFVKTELALRKEYELPPYTTRITLEGLPLTDLPEDLVPLFTSRKNLLEFKTNTQNPTPPNFLSISDKAKIIHDGPYVNFESTP